MSQKYDLTKFLDRQFSYPNCLSTMPVLVTVPSEVMAFVVFAVDMMVSQDVPDIKAATRTVLIRINFWFCS